MTNTLKLLLSLHVVFGLLGVACFVAVGLWLLKREPKLASLQKASVAGVKLLVASWLTGGYYYATYYGRAVRSVIKSGPYPWAHTFFMEVKEHVFLFLPFLGIAMMVLLVSRGQELQTSPSFKKQVSILSAVIAALGIFVTLAGPVISGAVR